MGSVIKQEGQQVNHLAVPEKMFEIALGSDTGIDKLERIMQMQEQALAKQARSDYLYALSMFQSKCPKIKKLKQGHNSKYAPLEDIIEQVKSVLFECGLSYSFSQDQMDGLIRVSCHLSHVGGHTETVSLTSEHDRSGNKQAIQALASAVSYLRRYTFTGVTGIVPSDEDSDGRIEQSVTGVSANDKTWVRAIKSGNQKLDDIADANYRAHIAGLLEQVQ